VIARIKDDHGGHARKVHGSAMGTAGEPDIDACIRGRATKVELKQPGNSPTPSQMGALRRWERVGALAGWVTNLVELDELLSHVDDVEWLNPQLEREPAAASA
jgi:hypothetical protein